MFVGIDVAKAELVMAIRPSGERWTATNDDVGIQRLLTRLRESAPALVVLEATGAYERPALGGKLRFNGRAFYERFWYEEVARGLATSDGLTARSVIGTTEVAPSAEARAHAAPVRANGRANTLFAVRRDG